MAFRGDRMQARRVELGVSRQAVADAIEMSVSYVGHLERGFKTNPSYDVLATVARLLGVGIEFLDGPARRAKPKGKKRGRTVEAVR